MGTSTSAVFAPDCSRCTLAEALHCPSPTESYLLSVHKKYFKCTHLKFGVYGCKQITTRTHTYTHGQCSLSSVAQAHPNKYCHGKVLHCSVCVLYILYLLHTQSLYRDLGRTGSRMLLRRQCIWEWREKTWSSHCASEHYWLHTQIVSVFRSS